MIIDKDFESLEGIRRGVECRGSLKTQRHTESKDHFNKFGNFNLGARQSQGRLMTENKNRRH